MNQRPQSNNHHAPQQCGYRSLFVRSVLISGVTLGSFLWMANSVDAAEHLMALGDFGNERDARPDGYADRLLWDDTSHQLVIHYLGGGGLDRMDRTGQVVSINIADSGTGYGRVKPGVDGLRIESFRRDELPTGLVLDENQTSTQDGKPEQFEFWTLPLVIDDEGTEGEGLAGTAILDGRAGAWSYYPINHAWENPLLDAGDFPITLEDNDLQLSHGGSGYAMPASPLLLTQSRLLIRLQGENLGSLGFTPGHELTESRYLPGDPKPITDTVVEFEITGDIINPFVQQPGNWRNVLAHTPASGDASKGWQLPWAASKVGQIADLRITADSMGQEIQQPEELLNDIELEQLQDQPEVHVSIDSDASLNLVEEPVEADEPVLIETEPTSGIGYEPGLFEIRDQEGREVVGWKIRYEIDADGRIYVHAKGSAKRTRGNISRQRVGQPDCQTYQHGWTIERNPSAIRDTSGWTLHPQGDGTGFNCNGILAFGQLVALPPISNHTDTPEGFDVQSMPEIVIERSPGIHAAQLAVIPPAIECRVPAEGRVIGTVLKDSGAGYYRTPTITLPESTIGATAGLVAILGDDGRRPIRLGEAPADVGLKGWEIHANGDFNGDGISDLFMHHPATGESAIWNLDHQAKIRMRGDEAEAHALPSLPTSWRVGGIGRFGLDETGCCILWRNRVSGQNVLWIVDSSRSDPNDWVRPESDFLPTVSNLGWGMACTNNAARNIGDRLFWIDPVTGSVAQWRIKVDLDRPATEWIDEPDYLRDPSGERILGMHSSWELIGAGSLGGQPHSDGSSAFRDLLFFDRESGRVAIWLLDGSGTQIDGSAPNGGAGFVTRGGSVIDGEIRYCRPVGIGQYAMDGVRWSEVGAGVEYRSHWFPTIGWQLPGEGPWFTWRFNRSVDVMRAVQGRLKGSGRSAKPFQVDKLR